MGRGLVDTRQTLLRAAATEILEHGYFAASLSGIAGRLGLTKGALSYHFPTKDHILHALMQHLTNEINEAHRIATQVFPDRPSRALVAFVSESTFRSSTNHLTAAAALITTEPAVSPTKLEGAFSNWHAKLTELMRRAHEEEQVPLVTTPENAAELIVGTVTGSRLTAKYTVHPPGISRPPYMRAALTGLGFPKVDTILNDVIDSSRRGEIRVLPGDIMGMYPLSDEVSPPAA